MSNPLQRLVERKVVYLRSVDFDCTICGMNFDLKETKKFSAGTFILAHVKSCLLKTAVRASPPSAPVPRLPSTS